MAGVPDWIPPVQAAGVKVKVIQTDEYFPHMAQGIAASDQVIKHKPEMVRKFVKAALHGMKDMMDDPDKAADDFVRFVPEWKGKEGGVKFAFNMYAKLVYPGQKELGEVNADRLAKLQDFYRGQGLHPEGDAGRRALYQRLHQIGRMRDGRDATGGRHAFDMAASFAPQLDPRTQARGA